MGKNVVTVVREREREREKEREKERERERERQTDRQRRYTHLQDNESIIHPKQ